MNQRKITALLLMAFMLLSMMPQGAAFAMNYPYAPENCPGHQWAIISNINEPTCTQAGTAYGICTRCGAEDRMIYVPALGHDWQEWDVTTDPTCTDYGQQVRVCGRCGASETRSIDPLGHDWGSWHTTREPTCTQAGARERTCIRCGETETGAIDALGHNYTSVTVIKEATCAETGLQKATCSRCGQSVEQTIPLKDHTWGEWYVLTPATPFAKGIEERKCQVCGLTEQREFYPDGTLKEGDRGEEVRQLQEDLNDAGYDCGNADGIYGPNTAAAVTQFETDHGIDGDGIAWPGVQGMIGSGGTAGVDPQPSTEPQPGDDGKHSASFTLAAVPTSETVNHLGQQINFDLTVLNTGNVPLDFSGYALFALRGGDYYFVPGEAKAIEAGDVDIYNLQPGKSYHIKYTAVVDQEDLDSDFVRFAEVTYYDNNGATSKILSQRVTLTLPKGASVSKPAISLQGSTEEYKSEGYTVGDQFPVQLTLTNTGDTALSAERIDLFVYNWDLEDFFYVATVYHGAANGSFKPGDSATTTYIYPITSEDVDTLVTLMFISYAMDPKSGQYVQSSEYMCEFEVGDWASEGDHPAITLSLESQDYDGACPGGTVTADVVLSNTGNVPVFTGVGSMVTDPDGADRSAESGASYRDGASGSDENPMFVGGSTKLRFSTEVTPEDIARGAVVRHYYELGNVAEMDGDSWMYTSNTIKSNSLTLEWPLGDLPGTITGDYPHVTLSANAPEGSATPFSWVEVPLTLTSDGAHGAYISVNNLYYDGELHKNSPEISSNGGTGDRHNLRPGQQLYETLSIYVTAEDAAKGYVERQVEYFYADADMGNEGTFATNAVTITLTIDPDYHNPSGEKTYALHLEGGMNSGDPAALGETVTASLLLTNMGNGMVLVDGFEELGFGGAAFTAETPNYDTDDFAGSLMLNPDEGHGYTFYITVTPNDVANGAAVRQVRYVGEGIWEIGNDNTLVFAGDEKVTSNWVTLSVPVRGDGVDESDPLLPKLVLSMTLASTVKEAYMPLEEVCFNWTLTNVGGSDIKYGNLLDYMYDAGIDAQDFTNIDSDDVVLKAHGGSVSGQSFMYLQPENMIGSNIHMTFWANGFYPGSWEYWMSSNTCEFDFAIDEYGWTPDPVTDPTQVSVAKWEASTAPQPGGYALGDHVIYDYTVNNYSACTITITATDDLFDDGTGNHELLANTDLAPDTEICGAYIYTVTAEDVARGYIENHISVTWTDPDTRVDVGTSSNIVVVPTVSGGVTISQPVGILKAEKTAPANGMFYTVGQEIGYNIVVYNDSDAPITNVSVHDDLSAAPGQQIGYITVIGAHEAVNLGFSHVVTDVDCAIGAVSNGAYMTYVEQNGNYGYAISNTVTSPCGYLLDDDSTDPNPTGSKGLTVAKKEVSVPANGSYYTLGEVIKYEIYIANSGKELLNDVIVTDSLGGVNGGEIAHISLLHPGEVRMVPFEHTVTEADVNRTYVINYASGVCTNPHGYWEVTSNPVISWTNANHPDTVPDISEIHLPLTISDDGSCTLTLNGKGDGVSDHTRHTCSVHSVTAAQVEALMSAAATPDEQLTAWTMARALWQAQVDELYEALYDVASMGQAQITVLNERLMFYAQLSAYEQDLALTYAGEPETVARLIAEAMMNKCTDMCYELSTAPEKRLDSLTGQHSLLPAVTAGLCQRTIAERTATDTRYTTTLCPSLTGTDAGVDSTISYLLGLTDVDTQAALVKAFDQANGQWLSQLNNLTNARYRIVDSVGKTAVSASRVTFTNWLTAREELLALIYPASPEIAAELISQHMMNRTIDLCALPKDDSAR